MRYDEAYVIELGSRVMLRFQSLSRDLRWFRGLWR